MIPEVNESINERIINGVKNTDSNDMQMLFGVIPTYSNDEKRKKREQKKRADRELSSIDQVGIFSKLIVELINMSYVSCVYYVCNVSIKKFPYKR